MVIEYRHLKNSIVPLIGAVSLIFTTSCNFISQEDRKFEKANEAFQNKDFVTAYNIYSDLAAEGSVRAQVRLGDMYKVGVDGVPENDSLAASWYRKAAERGDANASFNLAGMYWEGEGVPRDAVKGYAWHLVSASQGNPVEHKMMTETRNNMNSLEKKISDSQEKITRDRSKLSALRVKLQKLYSFTALAGSDIKMRYDTSNKILELESDELTRQADLVRSLAAYTLIKDQLVAGKELATRCIDSKIRDCD